MGEMNADELKDCVLDPRNRVLKKVTIQDAKEAEEHFKLFMGKDVAPRRDYIEEHAHLVDLTLM